MGRTIQVTRIAPHLTDNLDVRQEERQYSMYNLIVSGLLEDDFSSAIEIDQSRFLEYTNSSIRSQLENLSTEAIDCLKSWPCLLMQEGRGEEVMHLAQITNVEVEARKIKIAFSPVAKEMAFVNDAIWKLRHDLDIAEFEFSRNHWAVKDRELFSILNSASYTFTNAAISRFGNKPLPAPNRRELLRSRDVIGAWSHTEIDDFLLEAGISGLEAGRAIGSRRDRANAIIEYAFTNPQVTTSENSLFTAFIVRTASGQTREENKTAVDFSGDRRGEFLSSEQQETSTSDREPNRVFVVHGQNETARKVVVNEIKGLGLETIVLHEQPNMGRHLLTKFIEEAELVTFAIVLMTDDDVGGIKDGKFASRARQNVILELGYFLAHLGQPRVCALITPGLETPSDFDGIVYIRMDDEGTWKVELARELRAAGMPIAVA
jgi:predicted nucleotide-binding protein